MLSKHLFIPSIEYRHYTSKDVGVIGAEYARLDQTRVPLLSSFVLIPAFFRQYYSQSTIDQIETELAKGNDKNIHVLLKKTAPTRNFLRTLEEHIPEIDSDRLVTIILSPQRVIGTIKQLTIPPSTSNITQAIVQLLLQYAQEMKEKHLMINATNIEDFFPAFLFQFQRKFELSGLMWTTNPMDNKKQQMIVKAWWGRPEGIQTFQGSEDTCIIDKHTYEIVEENHRPQNMEIESNAEGVFRDHIPLSRQDKKKLTEKEIIELVMLAKQVHQHLFFPQLITWVKRHKKFFIVRSEDIIHIPQPVKPTTQASPMKPVLSGVSMGKGDAHAPVFVTRKMDTEKKMKMNEILVCKALPKNLNPRHCVGVIVEQPLEPRAFLHWNIPILANCKGATEKLKQGEKVFIDSSEGIVYC